MSHFSWHPFPFTKSYVPIYIDEKITQKIEQYRKDTGMSIVDDAPIVTNAAGGMGSKLSYAFHLIPLRVLRALAKVYNYGATKYAPWNWLKVEAWDHYNHMITHFTNFELTFGRNTDGSISDTEYLKDELEHFMCRASMYYERRMMDLEGNGQIHYDERSSKNAERLVVHPTE